MWQSGRLILEVLLVYEVVFAIQLTLFFVTSMFPNKSVKSMTYSTYSTTSVQLLTILVQHVQKSIFRQFFIKLFFGFIFYKLWPIWRNYLVWHQFRPAFRYRFLSSSAAEISAPRQRWFILGIQLAGWRRSRVLRGSQRNQVNSGLKGTVAWDGFLAFLSHIM